MMKFLFVKRTFPWPRSAGGDVVTYQMMRHLQKLGHSMALLTMVPPDPKALEGIELEWQKLISDPRLQFPLAHRRKMTWLQRRFTSFWGVPDEWIDACAAAVQESQCDVCVVYGRDLISLFLHHKNVLRVWYAADDGVLFHLSNWMVSKPRTWSHLKSAGINAVFEFVHRTLIDRAWMVTPKDVRYARFFMPGVAMDCVTNGVDSGFFSPRSLPQKSKSCVFWGRLDFPPNIDAVRWFSEHVWREIRRRHPDASFHVYGFAPTEEIRQMAQQFQFELVADSPDIRDAVSSCEVVVLPFISGAGIKNKLLEASGMQLPIIASTMAMNGIDDSQMSPCLVAKKPSQWIDYLERLWSDPKLRQSQGTTARKWCLEFASWNTTAKKAAAALQATQSTAKQ
jgi:glycosyltransferase involved in cell wall biosynthesis